MQLYVGLPGSEVTRPARQLAGFGIVDVTAGVSATIEITIPRDELAYWDQRVERWVVEGGDYVVAAGASSRDLRLSATVRVNGDAVAPPVTLESALEDVMRHPVAGELLSDAIAPVVAGSSNDESRAELNMDVSEMVARMPLSRIASFSQGLITKPQLEALIAEVERRALDKDGGPGPAGI
ncbi:MAG: fibronectin type III-like domain-contianing protein [Acidimicrobiales bacterium]